MLIARELFLASTNCDTRTPSDNKLMQFEAGIMDKVVTLETAGLAYLAHSQDKGSGYRPLVRERLHLEPDC